MGNSKSRIKPSGGPTKGNRLDPPLVSSEGTTNQLHPIFNLQHLEGDYCLSNCNDEQKSSFADALHKLSKLPWAEIQRSHRHGCGTEIIPRDQLKVQKFPAEATEDVNMLAFRFHGKASMVGYRMGRVFTVLFLDRNFTLYKHS